MRRRGHVRDNLYSEDDLDETTLAVLGDIPSEVYVIVRHDDPGTPGLNRFDRYPDLFDPVFATASMSVLRVDRDACREQAQKFGSK